MVQNADVKGKTMTLKKYLGKVIAFILRRAVQLLTGSRSLWIGCKPRLRQRIYYANHNSHIDFILLWASLPKQIRRHTRPVAGGDYWQKNRIRRFIIEDVFNGILIERGQKNTDSLFHVYSALQEGHSIIFFPEGTRNREQHKNILPFKSGLFHLAQHDKTIEIIPVWIANLNRVLPKGTFIPLPILSTVIFGQALDHTKHATEKELFLQYAQTELNTLREFEYK